MNISNQTEITKEQLLAVHVELEKLKLVRKDLLKETVTFVGIAVIVILAGLYIRSTEWTDFPVFPGAITVGGILLALGFRPLQQYKNELAAAEEKRSELEIRLKEDNLDYKVDIRITRDAKGEFDIKKSIQLMTNS